MNRYEVYILYGGVCWCLCIDLTIQSNNATNSIPSAVTMCPMHITIAGIHMTKTLAICCYCKREIGTLPYHLCINKKHSTPLLCTAITKLLSLLMYCATADIYYAVTVVLL